MVFSIISDALHALPRRRKFQREHYYYTNDKLFEQSLDIYRPATTAKQTSNNEASAAPSSSPSSPPIVALVVGSAWLGHRSFIYSQTSWWNSSGPKAVAELGCVSICIRHRGSFMKSISILTLMFVAFMVAIIATFTNTILDNDSWGLSVEEIVRERMRLGRAGGILLSLITGLLLIELGGLGAATFEDMQNDVMDALAWLEKNEERLHLTRIPTPQKQTTDEKANRRLFIFGGYSSGGHVAATVSQQPHLWKDRKLCMPHIHCDSMLYISPVLSTKPYSEILLRKVSSLSSSSSLPSLSPSEDGSATERLSRQSSLSSTSPTTWLTNLVVKAVFGYHVAHTIPSPIHTYEKSPPIPHIFLGCHNEMFGLDWLDAFFCSPTYSELLNSSGVESRYSAVHSDHWSILNSTQLSDALRKELKWIVQKGCNVKK